MGNGEGRASGILWEFWVNLEGSGGGGAGLRWEMGDEPELILSPTCRNLPLCAFPTFNKTSRRRRPLFVCAAGIAHHLHYKFHDCPLSVRCTNMNSVDTALHLQSTDHQCAIRQYLFDVHTRVIASTPFERMCCAHTFWGV